jgi:HEAT repeat protein
MLDHPSRYLRGRAALNLLAGWGDLDDVDRVIRQAERDPAVFARVKAAQALAANGQTRFGRIVLDGLGAADPFDRAAALDGLGALGLAEHGQAVAAQMKSDDPYVRLCAAEALDRIGTPRALAAAAASRQDADARVRLRVAKCLAARERGA